MFNPRRKQRQTTPLRKLPNRTQGLRGVLQTRRTSSDLHFCQIFVTVKVLVMLGEATITVHLAIGIQDGKVEYIQEFNFYEFKFLQHFGSNQHSFPQYDCKTSCLKPRDQRSKRKHLFYLKFIHLTFSLLQFSSDLKLQLKRKFTLQTAQGRSSTSW